LVAAQPADVVRRSARSAAQDEACLAVPLPRRFPIWHRLAPRADLAEVVPRHTTIRRNGAISAATEAGMAALVALALALTSKNCTLRSPCWISLTITPPPPAALAAAIARTSRIMSMQACARDAGAPSGRS